MRDPRSLWPELRYDQWKGSSQALHRWLQIVGKIRLSRSPWLNHSWHATLYLTARGLTTSLIHERERSFSMDFDFVEHRLRILDSDGRSSGFPLGPVSVAEFHRSCLGALAELGIETEIDPGPSELPDRTPFSGDEAHWGYAPGLARRFWRAMLRTDRVMQVFRSRFLGKASPVHLFWGGLDLAVTRFSGRRAPEHAGGFPHLPDLVVRDAYSHEVSSCGFWPGDDRLPQAAFYSYAYPEPAGFKTAQVRPAAAYYHEQLREFILPYDAVRIAESPEETLMSFFQSTYEAAASLGAWDRKSLEESPYLRFLQDQAKPSRRLRAA